MYIYLCADSGVPGLSEFAGFQVRGRKSLFRSRSAKKIGLGPGWETDSKRVFLVSEARNRQKTLHGRLRRRVFRRPQIQDLRSEIWDLRAKVANPLEECDDSGFQAPAPRSKLQGLNFDFFRVRSSNIDKNLARASAGAHFRRSLGSEICGL